MKMIRVLIQLPQPLKARLDAERKRGTTAAGLIRHLLEQHFKGKKAAMEHDRDKRNMLHLALSEEEFAHYERRAEAAGRTLEDQLRYELAVSCGLTLPTPGDREATLRGQFF